MRDIVPRTLDGLTELLSQALLSSTHITNSNSLFFTTMILLPTQQSPPPSFLPLPATISISTFSASTPVQPILLTYNTIFPFKRSVPSSSLESHHHTPPLSLHALGLRYPTPSPSFLSPLSPSRSSHVPLCLPPLPTRSRRTAHFQAVWQVTLAGLLFAFALPRFALPHGIF
jgi:hypothetical protein